MTTWRELARRAIEGAIAQVGESAGPRVRIAAIRAAYPFGRRKYWPYKIWLDEVKIALGRKVRGQRQRSPEAKGQLLLFPTEE